MRFSIYAALRNSYTSWPRIERSAPKPVGRILLFVGVSHSQTIAPWEYLTTNTNENVENLFLLCQLASPHKLVNNSFNSSVRHDIEYAGHWTTVFYVYTSPGRISRQQFCTFLERSTPTCAHWHHLMFCLLYLRDNLIMILRTYQNRSATEANNSSDAATYWSVEKWWMIFEVS